MRELYIIPDRSCIDESMQLAEKYQTFFEYNDFFLPQVLDDKEKVDELVSFYKNLKRDRSRDILHGAFLDVTVHSEDARVREISGLRVRQSMEIARKLGLRGVVFHTNMIPNFRVEGYMQHWLESNVDFWKQILREYPELEVFMENMFDETPDLLSKLAAQMKEEKRFGVCLDFAHAVAFGNADEIQDWMEKLLPYTKHMHINDNNLSEDLHQAVGQGKINWKQYHEFMEKWQMSCSVLVEVSGVKKQRESLEFMKAASIYPIY